MSKKRKSPNSRRNDAPKSKYENPRNTRVILPRRPIRQPGR